MLLSQCEGYWNRRQKWKTYLRLTMDADVISIEISRSKMERLADFARFRYPNVIGPDVYDIHSPRVPTT